MYTHTHINIIIQVYNKKPDEALGGRENFNNVKIYKTKYIPSIEIAVLPVLSFFSILSL